MPAAGTSSKIVVSGGAMGTGSTCPVTRNFEMVDQDPSDNVTTEYLLNPATGQTAQDTPSNAGNIAGSTLLLNGSDNTLLDAFIDPVLGCTPFTAPDLGNNDTPATSQALDELEAAANQPKVAALVPENDEMVLNSSGQFDAAKTDLYRAEIGQAPVDAATNRTSSPAMYCRNLIDIQTPFLAANQALLATGQPPVASVGDNLLTFLANRLNMSFTNLPCQNFGFTNPVYGHPERRRRRRRGHLQHHGAATGQHHGDGDADHRDSARAASTTRSWTRRACKEAVTMMTTRNSETGRRRRMTQQLAPAMPRPARGDGRAVSLALAVVATGISFGAITLGRAVPPVPFRCPRPSRRRPRDRACSSRMTTSPPRTTSPTS